MDFERLLARLVAVGRRLRSFERRELAEFRRWVENTNNLIHLSVLLFVPLLIGVVTGISNAFAELSFLLFPPLASGTYTLFADPEGRYASPWRFVGGLTVGALAGWAALELSTALYGAAAPGAFVGVRPESAALSILLTGGATWLLRVEEPAAFSTALLVLVTDRATPGAYVLSVAVFGTLVAGVFLLWREQFYEHRAQYLYGTVRSDDHVLVPMRGERSATVAMFGARLAAAHEAGKLVLLDIVDDPMAAALDPAGEGPSVDVDADRIGDAESTDAADEDLIERTTVVADRLESVARDVRRHVGVPCEVVVASGDPVATTLDAAHEANCDLVVVPYEELRGALSPFVRGVFGGPYDSIALRTDGETTRWRRVLVMVSRPGDTAHAMIDFATRLAGGAGRVSVCTCIGREVERRPAETTLANLVETVEQGVETRIARSNVTEYIAANADGYDLVIIGSSGDRSTASRFVSPPTFERLHDVSADVAVVDMGDP